ENFLGARDRTIAALRPFHYQRSHGGGDEDDRSEMHDARPLSRKRDRPSAHNFLGQPNRRFDSVKLRPDRIVTLGLLSQPLAKFWIAFSVVQGRAKLRIGIVDRSAIEKEDFFGVARIHLACSSGKLVSFNRRR